jgi:hypothetical protein
VTWSGEAATTLRLGVGDIRNTIESIGLNWREEALMLSTGESSGRNSNDSANITEVPPEGPREDLEGRIGQTVTNRLNKV